MPPILSSIRVWITRHRSTLPADGSRNQSLASFPHMNALHDPSYRNEKSEARIPLIVSSHIPTSVISELTSTLRGGSLSLSRRVCKRTPSTSTKHLSVPLLLRWGFSRCPRLPHLEFPPRPLQTSAVSFLHEYPSRLTRGNYVNYFRPIVHMNSIHYSYPYPFECILLQMLLLFCFWNPQPDHSDQQRKQVHSHIEPKDGSQRIKFVLSLQTRLNDPAHANKDSSAQYITVSRRLPAEACSLRGTFEVRKTLAAAKERSGPNVETMTAGRDMAK